MPRTLDAQLTPDPAYVAPQQAPASPAPLMLGTSKEQQLQELMRDDSLGYEEYMRRYREITQQ